MIYDIMKTGINQFSKIEFFSGAPRVPRQNYLQCRMLTVKDEKVIIVLEKATSSSLSLINVKG